MLAESVRSVQLMPSGDVAASGVPLATVQNNPNAGDQQTEVQAVLAGSVRVVQLMPSGDVAASALP
jgi:hypothetical protein